MQDPELHHMMLVSEHERVEHNFRNHPPVNDTVARVFDACTEEHLDLAHWIVDNVPESVERERALTALEQCSMQAKAGLARHQPPA